MPQRRLRDSRWESDWRWAIRALSLEVMLAMGFRRGLGRETEVIEDWDWELRATWVMRGIVLLVVGARIDPTLLLDLKRLGRFLFDFKFPRGTFKTSLRSFGESLKELNFWLLLFLE